MTVSKMQDANQKRSIRVTASQLLPVLIKNLLLLAFGMVSGYPTILIANLSDPATAENLNLNKEQISWIGSLNMLTLPLGCLLSGIISQKIGRKLTMQLSSILIIVCWITFRFCNDIWQIYVALTLFGLAGGLLESPVLTYVAEICEPRIRGSLLSMGPLCVTMGLFLEFLLGSIFGWRIVTQYSAIPPVASLVLLFIVPESPYWYITKNKLKEARKSLAWVRGWTTIEKIEVEFQEILANSSTDIGRFKLRYYTEPQFTKPFVLICFLFLIYHFSGVSTIPVYAVKTFQTLNVSINEYDATVILGLSQFLGCLLCVLIISYTGRRLLAFICIIVGSIGHTIVATYAHLANIKYFYFNNETVEMVLKEFTWIPLVFILTAAFALNCGLRTLPWNLLAEVFPMKTRAVATGALSAIGYSLGFASSRSFLATTSTITIPGLFWLYSLVGIIGLITIYFCLPEIEGKSLQEINDHFAGRTNLGNDVRRIQKEL